MRARKNPSKPRPRKKPGTISTNAALFTATMMQLTLDQFEGGDLMPQAMAPFINSAQGTTVLPLENLGEEYRKAIMKASEKAAKLLSLAALGERLFNRLDFRDPKHVVTAAYCVVRLFPTDSKDAKKQIKMFGAIYGKYWRWRLVWDVTLLYETVKRRYDLEAAKGQGSLLGWRDQVQRFANNFWLEEKKKSPKVATEKKMMIEAFQRHPAVKPLLAQS